MACRLHQIGRDLLIPRVRVFVARFFCGSMLLFSSFDLLAADASPVPAPNVKLRLFVNDKAVDGEADLVARGQRNDQEFAREFNKNIVALPAGHSAKIRVVMIAGTSERDVTHDAATRYDSLSPWKLAIVSAGLVSAVPESDFARIKPPLARYGLAKVQISYVDKKRGRFGYNAILFEVRPLFDTASSKRR